MSLTPDEREELLAAGLLELLQLAEAYVPHRPGYTDEGRLSGYAASLLPHRLADAWHRLHRGEHARIQVNGTRRWVYSTPAPLDEATTLVALDEEPDLDRLEAALAEIEPWQRLGVRRMLELARDGAGSSEIAEALGVDRGRLAAMRERLGAALVEEPRE